MNSHEKATDLEERLRVKAGWRDTQCDHLLHLAREKARAIKIVQGGRGHRDGGVLFDSDIIRTGMEALFESGHLTERYGSVMRGVNMTVEENVDDVRAAYEKFRNHCNLLTAEVGKFIPELRSQRMTLTSECGQIVQALGDIKEFLFSETFSEQMERLERAASVCERLQQLKKAGTLDALVDLAIKMEVGHEG
jgi:hypothetical protein